jgi:hypothetical protein
MSSSNSNEQQQQQAALAVPVAAAAVVATAAAANSSSSSSRVAAVSSSSSSSSIDSCSMHKYSGICSVVSALTESSCVYHGVRTALYEVHALLIAQIHTDGSVCVCTV